MAWSFQSAEAQGLIEQQRSILNRMDSVLAEASNQSSQATKAVQRYIKDGLPTRIMLADLCAGAPAETESEETAEYLAPLRAVLATTDAVNALQKARNYADQAITPSILTLTSLPGVRIFVSRARKDEAERAYVALREAVYGQYTQNAEALMNELTQAWEHGPASVPSIGKKRKSYRKTLEEMASPCKVRSVQQISQLLDVQKKKESAPSKVKSSLRSATKKAKAEIENYLEESLNQTLEGTPIEELGKARQGLRIKALRDAGYETAADILRAPLWRIAGCKGISPDGARVIKLAAEALAMAARPLVRVRLNADNRDAKSNRLVVSLAKVKRLRELAETVKDHDPGQERKAENSKKILEALGDGRFWPVLDDSSKQGAIDAYQDLSALVKGPYGKTALGVEKELTAINSLSATKAWNDFAKNPIAYSTLIEKLAPGSLGSGSDCYGLPEELALQIRNENLLLDGLHCTLRRYQEWGVKYILHQEKVLLGDEMGLGKTVQAIAAMVSLKNTGAKHFFVVCPASVVSNWCREIEKHSTLRAIKLHGTDRLWSLREWEDRGGVAVTTYDTIKALHLTPEDDPIDFLVVDEAHYIKNSRTARARNTRKLCAQANRSLFMTGTALENKVDEMVDIIQILNPAVASKLRPLTSLGHAQSFRDEAAIVYYRRKRDDVLTELPDLIQSEEWCPMTPQERAAYKRTVLSRNSMAIRRVSWNVEDLAHSSKAQRLAEIVQEAKDDGRKVIVFSFFLETLERVHELLGDICTDTVCGSVPARTRQEIIDGFDAAGPGTVLPAQIQSGGTGLNIQSASVVVICEPQFKPSTENQAISRAYRMGQSRNVLVYRLLCDDSIDERLVQILEKKQREFDAFADKSTAASYTAEIDTKAFSSLVDREIERIKAIDGQ